MDGVVKAQAWQPLVLMSNDEPVRSSMLTEAFPNTPEILKASIRPTLLKKPNVPTRNLVEGCHREQETE